MLSALLGPVQSVQRQAAWRQQSLSLQERKLLSNPAYKSVYMSIGSMLACKGERPDANEDPLAGTAGETLSSKQQTCLADHQMKQNTCAKDRDLALNNWLLGTCGRSDDGRLMYQGDFQPPRRLNVLGKCQETSLFASFCHDHLLAWYKVAKLIITKQY